MTGFNLDSAVAGGLRAASKIGWAKVLQVFSHIINGASNRNGHTICST
jgi:hypothetical protein